jgi:hypothetical protein
MGRKLATLTAVLAITLSLPLTLTSNTASSSHTSTSHHTLADGQSPNTDNPTPAPTSTPSS